MSTDAAAVALDALPSMVAVLDADGVVAYANRAWRTFGAESGTPDAVGLRASYLEVGDDRADHPFGAEVGAGLRELLSGDLDFYATLCPSPAAGRRRWFSLNAFGDGAGDDRRVLVVHDDVPGGDRSAPAGRAEDERLSMLAEVLSHDLTNSLSVARGYLALLAEEVDSPYVGPLSEAVERMTDITEAAGLVARLDAVTEFEPVDVGLLARRTWLGLELEPATITVEEVGVIEADPDLLLLLLENLFANAVDHGGADVHVTVGPLDEGFYVADDGPGIPAGRRADAFDAGHTTANDHTGLGLAIVAHIACAHGWTVRVTDADSGGTRVEISAVGR